MRSILILAIFAMFVFASCHSDVPELPSAGKIKFCKYKDKDGVSQCKSTYEVSEADCKALEEKGDAELIDECPRR